MNKFTLNTKWCVVAVASALAASACTSTRTQRGAGEYIDDSALTAQVKTALIGSPDVKGSQVEVEVFRGVAQLNGFVDSASAKTAATRLAREVDGVRDVRNNLTVTDTKSTPGEAVDDAMLTAKVKTALIDEPQTKAHDINVGTEAGVVNLSGFVDTAAEKSKATSIARSIAGVRDVRNEIDVKQAR